MNMELLTMAGTVLGVLYIVVTFFDVVGLIIGALKKIFGSDVDEK